MRPLPQIVFRKAEIPVPDDAGVPRMMRVIAGYDDYGMLLGTIVKGPLGDWISRIGQPEEGRPGMVHRRQIEARQAFLRAVAIEQEERRRLPGHETWHPVRMHRAAGAVAQALLVRLHELSPSGAALMVDIRDDGRVVEHASWPLRFSAELMALSGREDEIVDERVYLVPDRLSAERMVAQWPRDVAGGYELVLRRHPEYEEVRDAGRRVASGMR